MTELHLDPDRLFPADPATRTLARELYREVAGAPILSPHGHVEASMLAANQRFADPAALLIIPDHYVLRLLHAHGIGLAQLGRVPVQDPGSGVLGGSGPGVGSSREVWRLFCGHWNVFAGTPVRYWFESVFADVFGLTQAPSAANADALFDQIDAALDTPQFLPRALCERFGLEVLATTDDPSDSLAAHQELAEDESFTTRVIPTFRADRFMDPGLPGFGEALAQLSQAADVDAGNYVGLLEALRRRRTFFKAQGATATDTGVPDAWAIPLPEAEAERIHQAGLRGEATLEERRSYRRNMLYQFAAMSVQDGLVMQLHPAVLRNHHAPTFETFGTDTGHDVPDVAAYSRPLQRLLNDFGTDPVFQMVLFSVDETSFAREIGPLAGFYPAVFAGAPWWFLDTPSAIRRYREAITDSAGFYKTSGFVDDTRAFCSIPARHDMSRRVDSAFLAELVVTGQLEEGLAHQISRDMVGEIVRRAFRLKA